MLRISLVATALLMASTASADGGLVYPSEGKLWLRNDDGKGARAQLAVVPGGGAVDQLQVDAGGRMALVRSGQAWHWLGLTSSFAHRLPCKGEATLSGNGRCVVCLDDKGRAQLFWLKGRKVKRTDLRAGGPVGFTGGLAVVSRGGSLTAINALRRGLRRLSSHVPQHSLSVSPNGKRAVGFYPGTKEKKNLDGGLYTFKLDGEAVKRRLVDDAQPIRWSLDSEWLVANMDDNGCVFSGRGGQYKCWKGYRASAIDRAGKTVFLLQKREGSKVVDVFAAPTKGARPLPAKVIIRDVDGPVVWTRNGPPAATP